MGLSGGRAHDRSRVERNLLAIGAMAGFLHDDSDDGVAELESVGTPPPTSSTDSRRLHAWHVGRRIGFLLLGARAVANPDVGWVDRRGMDADPHLSGQREPRPIQWTWRTSGPP